MAPGDSRCTCDINNPRCTSCPRHSVVNANVCSISRKETEFDMGAYSKTAQLETNAFQQDISDPDTTCKKFHGIIHLSEEALLEALGIHDPNVHIKGVTIPFGYNSVKIQLVSNEQQIDAGSGNVIDLTTIKEGEEIPVVTMHEDIDQRDIIIDPRDGSKIYAKDDIIRLDNSRWPV